MNTMTKLSEIFLYIRRISDHSRTNSTYGSDDSSSKKEGITQAPVARYIGGVRNGIHSTFHCYGDCL